MFLINFPIIVVSFLITILLLYISYKYIFKYIRRNYIVIKDYSTFSKYNNDLQKSKQIGVDTEHYNDNTYKGQLCLIQLYISKYPFSLIIDLIELQNNEEDKIKIYDELKKIFQNKKIEKIFHSCHNDIKWIFETLNCDVINVFDTQLMDSHIETKIKNNKHQNRSLNYLFKKYLNIHITDESKKLFQKSNWLKRPLTHAQLQYAANDALYLIELRKKMFQFVNNEKEFNEAKKVIYKQIKNKIEEKKDEQIKQFAVDYMNNNMTVIKEDKYFELSKELFIDLMKKVDEFASKNNLDTEKILSVSCIYNICKKLPTTKEKAHKIIEISQSIKFNNDNLNHNNNDSMELYNIKNNFYKNIIEFINEKAKEIEKYISEENPEINNRKEEINARKANVLKILKKEASKKNTMSTFICKHPIYESCKMLAPDGQQLCFCDNKKMSWYVSRNLAEIISKDPPVFRLYFEPNARGCVDENLYNSNFYTAPRSNCCVICGSTENYLRFHIVPLLYRSCFPENLKSHKSHDVVLLCLSCHEKARIVYDKKKREISEKYEVPLNVQSDGKINYLKLLQFQKKCKVLRRVDKPLAEQARKKLIKDVFNSIKKLKEDFEDLRNFMEANEIKCEKEEDINENFLKLLTEKFEISNYNDVRKNMHGQLVLEKVKDLKKFIIEWRKFFIESFNPKFLPKEWSIEHEIVRTFGEHSNFKNKESFVDNKAIKKSQ